MTAPTDPVALLREAARLLTERAAEATPPPWTLYDRGVGWEINELPQVHDGTTFTRGDGRWIALASPGLAEPLAAWLESAAGAAGYDLACQGHDEDQVTGRYAEELAVARAIVEAGQP